VSYSGQIFGREAELSRLLSLLESGITAGGRFVLLTGEPGIGKTRLTYEVLRSWLPDQVRVVAGRCFEQYMHVPFFPFSEG
jgi:predicted ATPase